MAVSGARHEPDVLANQDDYAHALLAYRYVLALVASIIALVGMMAWSQPLVTAVLLLAIRVSFIWETIGIGPSPNRLVPASGLVVLVLTVGYAFVVWERLPFAAANLTTAVAGMRAHPQLLGVVFGCQVLVLLTSVYFLFAHAGLHHAIHNAPRQASGAEQHREKDSARDVGGVLQHPPAGPSSWAMSC